MQLRRSALLYQSGKIRDIRDMASKLYSYGIRDFYLADHLIGGGNAEKNSSDPWLAMFPTLLDIASRHDVNVGTLVASPILRSAAQLAIEASTCAHIVGSDKFTLTIGAGGAKSDQQILGLNLDVEDLSLNFEKYVSDFLGFLKSSKEIKLRLAETKFRLRLASDSMRTIPLVAKHADGWVTSGGWKKNLEIRGRNVNELYRYLNDNNFKGSISLLVDPADPIEITSSDEDIQSYLSFYECPIDEIVFSISPKNIAKLDL